MHRRLVVLALAVVAAVGCSSGTDLITATAEEIEGTGVNITGRIDITADRWVEIAEIACDAGAWDWEVAADVFQREIGELHPNATPGSGPQAVWLLTATACHDSIPADAIEQGPPPFEG